MMLAIILGGIVLAALGLMGFLFYMLNKETQKEDAGIQGTRLEEIKKRVEVQVFEQNTKVIEKDDQIIPVFAPKPVVPEVDPQIALENEKFKKRAQELEDELLAISKKADGQSQEAKQMIETLTRENESLKKQQTEWDQAQEKLFEVQKEATALRMENLNVQTQLISANDKVRLLEEEVTAIKLKMDQEIRRANEVVTELVREKEVLLAAPKPDVDADLRRELENLKGEHGSLKQECDTLKQRCEEMEKANQALQYDLIKARAQSSGLERVSFNYKNQLEDFFKKINAAQANNLHLAQVKNRLEGMVEEIKLQNEELVRKDQLVQFELEKNRSRLVNLEREYEELKARVQQRDQQ